MADKHRTAATAGAPLPDEVRAAMARGDKLEAIKLLREATGLGLAAAKQAVEQDGGMPTPGARSEAQITGAQTKGLPAEVVLAVQQGRKIDAIRMLRAQTGMGMKQARLAVEAIPDDASALADTYAPGEVRSRSGAWWWVLVVLVLLGWLVYRWAD